MQVDRRGAAAGLSAYVMWGFLTAYWHELHGLSPVGLVGERIVWASVLLAIIVTAQRHWQPLRAAVSSAAVLKRVVTASLLLTVNWSTYVWAVTHDHVVETALGYFISPLVTVALGVLVFHEHLRRNQAIALAFATGAVALLTIEAGKFPIVAILLSFSWGFYGLIKRTVALLPIESLTAETLVLLPIALVVTAFVESGKDSIIDHASGLQLALVVGTGAVTAIPLLIFAFAAPRVPFTVLGPMQYAAPFVNFVLGAYFYKEQMSGLRYAGFGLVWIAILIFVADSFRASRATQAERRHAESTIPSAEVLLEG